jgi:hypothetical protein
MWDEGRLMNGAFVESRLGVEQAICLIESFAKGDGNRWSSRRPRWPWPDDDVFTVREEIVRLQNSPQAAAIAAQAENVWDSAVHRKKSTVWFLRTYRPVTMLVFQICRVGAISCGRLLAGNFFPERDFPVLTGNASKQATAPLKLCDARPPGAFLNSLAALMSVKAPCSAVCDWALEGDELAAARHASREAEISFSCLG